MSRLYLSNPCALFHYPLHTVLRAQSAPGFPCALCSREGHERTTTRAKLSRGNTSARHLFREQSVFEPITSPGPKAAALFRGTAQKIRGDVK